MPAHHIVISLRASIGRDRETTRRVVGALLRGGRGAPLVAFHLSDGHVHVLALLDRVASGRVAQRLGVALRAVLGDILEPAQFTLVRDQTHLARTFEYILRNDEKHGVEPDPWRENGALPYLLGLRDVDSELLRTVLRVLPRVHGSDLRAMAGWPEFDVVASNDGVADAAAAALALPALTGRRAAVVAARRAIVTMFPAVSAVSLAQALGVSREDVRVLRGSPPARPELVRAIGLQIALRSAVPLPAEGAFSTVGARLAWPERRRVLR